MSRFSMLAAGFVVFAVRAAAQDVLLEVKSPVPGADAAVGIAIGDWDGDGVGDLAIGAPFDDTVASEAGAARVHSGKDGRLLAQFFGTNADGYFGEVLARIPDLNGDGVDELAVAAPYANFNGPGTGSVFLYAGLTGALLRRIDGPASDIGFGVRLGSAGDVDGDGFSDLFASRFTTDGAVDLVSGADGHTIRSLNGSGHEFFGSDVALVHDLDGDGVKDLLIGAKDHKNASGALVGAAYVVSAASGTVLRTQTGTFSGEGFGYVAASLSDLDGDGVRDYAVSATYDDSFFSAMVQVFSGATGAQLAKIVSPSSAYYLFPLFVGAGDLDGDGFDDLAISGLWVDSKRYGHAAAFLVSGRTFQYLDRIETPDVGVALAPCGDLNGDGLADLIVGSWDSTLDGRVRVFAGDELWLNGTPSDPLQGDSLVLMTREGPAGGLTVLALVDVDGAPTFQLIDGVGTFGPLGGRKVTGTVPSGLAGHVFTFRAFANDASGRVVASAEQEIAFQ